MRLKNGSTVVRTSVSLFAGPDCGGGGSDRVIPSGRQWRSLLGDLLCQRWRFSCYKLLTPSCMSRRRYRAMWCCYVCLPTVPSIALYDSINAIQYQNACSPALAFSLCSAAALVGDTASTLLNGLGRSGSRIITRPPYRCQHVARESCLFAGVSTSKPYACHQEGVREPA